MHGITDEGLAEWLYAYFRSRPGSFVQGEVTSGLTTVEARVDLIKLAAEIRQYFEDREAEQACRD